MKTGLGAAFDELAAGSWIGSWSRGIDEAETAAFGGGAGMDLAHELFSADSRAVVDLLRNGGSRLGRRELSLLLCSSLMLVGITPDGPLLGADGPLASAAGWAGESPTQRTTGASGHSSRGRSDRATARFPLGVTLSLNRGQNRPADGPGGGWRTAADSRASRSSPCSPS